MADDDPRLARLQRQLAKSQMRRNELEHLIDTGQAFQRSVLAEVEDARAKLEELNVQLKREQKRTDLLLHSIMPQSVADELKRTGGVVPKRVENATVMFADFVAFTEHSERLDPLVLVRILDQYYSEFDRIVARNGVEKVKTIGDAYMCVAGLDDDPLAASHMVHAAHETLLFIRSVRPHGLAADLPLWEIKIGINTGPVSTGVIGQDRLSFDIWGDTVNVASRIVSACAPNGILMSQHTHNHLQDKTAFTPNGRVELRGHDSVETYQSTQ